MNSRHLTLLIAAIVPIVTTEVRHQKRNRALWHWRTNEGAKYMLSWRNRRSQNRFRTTNATAADCFQTLEDRAMLTGNVLASLSGSNLTVSGDAADNQLEVTVLNNQVILRGLTNTTINGSTALFVIADNTDTAPGNITIETGAGNDTVILSRNIKVAGTTWLDGGAGNDALGVDGATFHQTLSIYGRTGNDTITVQNATTAGLLQIKGKSGDDLISLTNLTANGALRIEGNRGIDGISLKNVTAAAKTKIKTGAGNDDIVIQEFDTERSPPDSDKTGFRHVADGWQHGEWQGWV